MYLLLLLVFVMSTAIANVSAAPKKEDSATTVKGSIKDSGKSFKNSLVILQEKGKLNRIFATTDSSGTFKTKLTDGTYAVKAVKSKNSDWYSTHKDFVVKEGKIKGLKDGEIHLSDKKQEKQFSSKSSNLNGVLKEGNKGFKADLIISKYNEYEEEIYTVSTKGNGSFSASLPDGTYFLFGIEADGGFYRYELGFTVVDGKVLVDGEPLTNLSITVPVNAHAGKVGDSSNPLAEASIVLEKRVSGEEYDSEFIQYAVTDKKGEFSLRELEDGIYTISVYHETYYSWNHVTIEVLDGTIFIDGEKSAFIHISVPDVNIKGTLSEGKKPITNAYINIEGETSDGEYNGYGTPVDSKGNFQYRLPDGMYTIFSIDEQNRNTMVNIPFEIRDGKLLQDGEVLSTLNIVVPPVTFTGKLVESGVSLQGAISVERVSEDGNNEGYHTTTDENGIYSLRLKDGSYRVTNGYLFDEDEEVGFSASFEIINGKLFVNGEEQTLLELEVPPVSVNGLVKDGENTVANGYISVASEDYSLYIGKSINSDGTFTMRLPDGNYQVLDIYLEDGTSLFMNQAFTIQDGKMYLGGELQDVLEINVPPVTVTGTLTESGNPLMGEIHVMEINDPESPLEAWGSANEEGRFQFRLPDGEYKVYNVYLQDSSSFSPEIEFSVSSGQLYVNGELKAGLEIVVPPVTVTGTLTESGNPTMGSINIMEINNADNPLHFSTWAEEGHFQLRLPDGDYRVDQVYFEDGTSFNPGTEFSVVSGQLYVNGERTEQLNIAVTPVTVSGTVHNGEEAVTDGYVTINTLDGNWATDSWIQNGNYKGRLPDGEYMITMVNDFQNGVYNFDKGFTINDGKIYVEGQEVSSLDINLQDGWQQP